jgi:hypothetical protein
MLVRKHRMTSRSRRSHGELATPRSFVEAASTAAMQNNELHRGIERVH